ncbi:MAG: metal ABC transporter permease [Xanthomonadales bacterium]|nr:metal ABC transporter permease [Gammaproteobacteria bacterium]MBT8053369.1 metal ABC transporter permease [Gammaproteobacteria bacterium]NND55642.1 metal ABC transporter permease [Xanthomonadales bacterium]NNK50489.1 metal ABC transporter permease [Xanthomonadales bacterium]
MSWDLLDWTIIGPALVAGLLVLSTHVPLGQVVLRRGIIFIDLAVAQVAALGVIAAGSMGLEDNMYAVQVSAVGAALLAAAGLNWTEKYWPDIQEALIGTLFVLAATGSIILLAENPHGGEYLKDILVGQILWTTWHMLIPIAALYVLLLAVWYIGRARIGPAGFYVTFAFAITAAVQIVGVYLVFASLILPALATRRMQGAARLTAGYVVGGLSYLAGITVSALLDLPTGAVIVWTMAVFSVIAGYLVSGRAADLRRS